jgi:putative ABC transport system permease protein
VAGLQLLLGSSPNAIPRSSEIGLDWAVLGATLAATLVTGLVFGLVPLAHVSRARVGASLKDAAGRTTAGRARTRARSTLVVAEIALAMLLVVGAGC